MQFSRGQMLGAGIRGDLSYTLMLLLLLLLLAGSIIAH